MKNITAILFLALLLLNACGSSNELESLKAEKASIQSEINSLKTKLITLDEEIAKLDTSASNDKLELVTIIPLNKTDFSQYIEAQGKTFSDNDIMVTTDMGGLVKGIYVDEGQYVSKGQSLIQLDNSVIQTQLTELETGISLAKDVFEKRERLWNQNIGSQIEYLQAKNNYESLINKKATIQTQLGKSTIKSPISGYVDLINLNIGEMAAPGQPAIHVINNKNLEVKVDLPEIYLGKVSKGDQIIVAIPALNISTTAKVTSVSQSVNSFNRAFQVIASIDNSKGLIKTNMLAKVKFTNQKVANSIVIPTALLQEGLKNGEKVYFVYTAEVDSASSSTTAIKNFIEVGESYGGDILVKSGLKSGDLIIDKGFRNVLDGQLISIQ